MDVQSLRGASTQSLRKTIGTVSIVGLFFLSTCQASNQEVAENADPSQIKQWLSDLASPWPIERERAYLRLKNTGLAALEQLLLHRSTSDPQVQASLEQLLLELETAWLEEIRSGDVRMVLADFHNQVPEDQFSRIQQLAAINTDDAVRTLCLVCRYELDESLGRLAATHLLEILRRDDDKHQEHRRKIISVEIQNSSRAACRWLQIGLELNPLSELASGELVQTEQQRIQSGDQLARQASRHLLTCLVGLARESNRSAELTLFSSSLLDLLIHESLPPECIELADVLIAWQDWDSLKKLEISQANETAASPGLLLRLAHAAWAMGDREVGNKHFESAISIAGGYPSSLIELGATMHAQHYDLLAESIWRRVITSVDDSSMAAIRSRLLLAELVADQQRHDDAAELVHQTLVVLQRIPESAVKLLKALQVSMEFLFARECFFRAEAFRAAGDNTNQCIWLMRGLQSDPESSDLLIAALNASTPTSRFRGIVMELIDLRCAELQLEIDRLQAQVMSTPKADERYLLEQEFARECNRLAWLMACTQRSDRRAVLLAQQAVALDSNNAHFIDTLARSLFVLGDVNKAVAIARQARHLDPGNAEFRENVRHYENTLLQTSVAGGTDLNLERK
jgi:tetratricopeptide (TPR) repeat protein